MKLKASGVQFKYGKKLSNILEDVSFEVEDSSIYVLLGLNGCGKTTLIKVLAGLLPYSKGSIKYGELELSNIKIRDRSKIFAYVPQKISAGDDVIVRDYLAYGFVNKLKFYERPKITQLEKIKEISEEVGITNLLDKQMNRISGGERQIVTIASCILQDTPIILLDEPMSALDLKNQNLVLSLLKKISSEGKTIVLSSHNPNHALFLNSNAILLNKGKVVESGLAKEIIKVELLKSIYGDEVCESSQLDYSEISFKSANIF